MSKLDDRNKIIRTLLTCNGNIAAASKILGVNRSSLRDKINNDEELAKTLSDIREGKLDQYEDVLHKIITEKGNLRALEIALAAMGKSRGYGATKTEIEIQGQVTHVHQSDVAQNLLKKFEESNQLIDITPDNPQIEDAAKDE